MMIKKYVFVLFAVLFSGCFYQGCSENKIEKIDLTISQKDIDLVIKHKKNIDKITGKYDLELQKTKQQNRQQVLEKGKEEINKYLTAQGLSPVVFMRKSKKILKGFLAFQETSEAVLQKKMSQLENQDLTQDELTLKMNVYKKANEALFAELTTGLSDYEIQLIKSNLKNLSEIVK